MKFSSVCLSCAGDTTQNLAHTKYLFYYWVTPCSPVTSQVCSTVSASLDLPQAWHQGPGPTALERGSVLTNCYQHNFLPCHPLSDFNSRWWVGSQSRHTVNDLCSSSGLPVLTHLSQCPDRGVCPSSSLVLSLLFCIKKDLDHSGISGICGGSWMQHVQRGPKSLRWSWRTQVPSLGAAGTSTLGGNMVTDSCPSQVSLRD